MPTKRNKSSVREKKTTRAGSAASRTAGSKTKPDHNAQLARGIAAKATLAALRMGSNQAEREMVNHPQHYGGDVQHEVIKCLESWGLEMDALLWNAVKYIARAGKKTFMLEDLEKARFYLDRRIMYLRSESGQPQCPDKMKEGSR
jgi:hypothetical protein